jgi:regulator of cell morphogenesis and NO signaling
MTTEATLQPANATLNVTLLEPRMKHPTIFNWFDALQPGEGFTILNDHDPKPLYYQLIGERGNVFNWTYEENGPTVWRVVIKKNDVNEGPTVGEIAASDIRKAEVFKKYGLDFCCGGKKSLQQACAELNIDAAVVESELLEVAQGKDKPNFDFNRWEPDFLADYIYNQHHTYYYNEGPIIGDLLQKVAGHHGDTQPHLLMLAELYRTLVMELNSHFIKEERILFPHIKQLMQAKRGNIAVPAEWNNINGPIQVMEADHDAAGDLLKQMRELTHDYTLPESACNSFALLYKKLQDLEEDLHLHIHLENNILFPKAAKLEKELINRN